MKYVVEMGSVVMIYLPSFTEIGTGIQKLMGESIRIRRHTHTQNNMNS
jgi:hypothetical protein